jgi:hypothetical protein
MTRPALELKHLRVTSLDIDFHEVTWEVLASEQDVLDYKFAVLRSEAQEGPYDNLSGDFEDRYSFVDNVIQVTQRWRTYWYKVRVTRKLTGESVEFGPVSMEPIPDLIAVEVRRHVRLLFQEYAGRRCVILPRRTFGQRCECFDKVLGKRTRAGCRTCFDTGFVRGYMHPIETWIQVDPSAKTKQQLGVAETQQDNTTMRLGYYPSVKPDDLIIEPENKRWRVIQQNQTEHSRAAVHQEIAVHRIPERDIEYAIPVDFGTALKNLYYTPSRNYSNPHNFQNFENESLPGIFELYRNE